MSIFEALAIVRKHGNKYAAAYAGRALVDWYKWNNEQKLSQLLYVKMNISQMRKPDKDTVRQTKEYINDEIEALR